MAQEDDAQQDINVDDLGNVSNTFKEQFFEALKQKGIENYDRAIQALQRCLAQEPKNAVIHFELGKNYNALKQYDAAEESLKEAIITMLMHILLHLMVFTKQQMDILLLQ